MDGLRKNYKKIISLKKAKKIVALLIFVLCFDFFLSPLPAMASQIMELTKVSENAAFTFKPQYDFTAFNGKLPKNENMPVVWSKYLVVTAYTSETGQTDGSPCITANNFNLCDQGIENTIAANFLPFGAKVRMPELFGDRIFIVRDRMNKRFPERVDIWMIEKPDAIKFGVKVAKIEVLK